jgi:16S rRNA (guanine527-N7)-methyltransferase
MTELQSAITEVLETYVEHLNGRKETVLDRFETFLEMLRHRGRDNNLTGFRDNQELATQVVGDALAPLACAPDDFEADGPEELLDVGSGPGIPGIVYAIYWPNCDVTLLESNKKRLEFLHEAIETLDLENVQILEGRAEAHAHALQWRERFDMVTSRALAPLPIALELCLPYLALDGWMLTYKGTSPMDEVKDAEFAIGKLGAGKAIVKPYHAGPGANKSHAVWIPKIGLTPDRYPRREGIPAKRPLRGSRS